MYTKYSIRVESTLCLKTWYDISIKWSPFAIKHDFTIFDIDVALFFQNLDWRLDFSRPNLGKLMGDVNI